MGQHQTKEQKTINKSNSNNSQHVDETPIPAPLQRPACIPPHTWQRARKVAREQALNMAHAPAPQEETTDFCYCIGDYCGRANCGKTVSPYLKYKY